MPRPEDPSEGQINPNVTESGLNYLSRRSESGDLVLQIVFPHPVHPAEAEYIQNYIAEEVLPDTLSVIDNMVGSWVLDASEGQFYLNGSITSVIPLSADTVSVQTRSGHAELIRASWVINPGVMDKFTNDFGNFVLDDRTNFEDILFDGLIYVGEDLMGEVYDLGRQSVLRHRQIAEMQRQMPEPQMPLSRPEPRERRRLTGPKAAIIFVALLGLIAAYNLMGPDDEVVAFDATPTVSESSAVVIPEFDIGQNEKVSEASFSISAQAAPYIRKAAVEYNIRYFFAIDGQDPNADFSGSLTVRKDQKPVSVLKLFARDMLWHGYQEARVNFPGDGACNAVSLLRQALEEAGIEVVVDPGGKGHPIAIPGVKSKYYTTIDSYWKANGEIISKHDVEIYPADKDYTIRWEVKGDTVRVWVEK